MNESINVNLRLAKIGVGQILVHIYNAQKQMVSFNICTIVLPWAPGNPQLTGVGFVVWPSTWCTAML